MRLFIGTLLGPPDQRFYQHLIKELILQHPGVLRSIPEHSAHFTYVFCADADERLLDAISGAVRTAAEGHPAFEIRLGCPHVIPAGSRPRLVCADASSGDAQLQRLSADVVAALRLACPNLSLSPSRSPHVTLARFRKQATRADAQAVSRSLSATEASTASRPARIVEVQVLTSVLTPSGPVYSITAHVPLPS